MGLINYKLVLSYDGTDFSGWQRQPDVRTVQGVLEVALEKIAGKKVAVTGAGRTDAGVHARGQVANFLTDLRLHQKELLQALNALLPGDVRILSIRKAPSDFNSRKAAKSKVYEYRIYNPAPSIPRRWPRPPDFSSGRRISRPFARTASSIRSGESIVLKSRKGDRNLFTLSRRTVF
jgi:tRNA pseudouridine38-40 synthase